MNLVTTLVSTCVILSVILQWLIYKHNLKYVYIVMIAAGASGAILNVILAIRHPEQWSLVLFVLTALWQALMGVKALMRLDEKRSGT